MDDYLDELARRGRAPRTIKTYRRILYAFADRFHIDTRVGELESSDIRAYLRSAPGTDNTRAHREVVVRCWIEWCSATGRVERDPLEGASRMRRTPRSAPPLVDDAERMRLMESVRTLSWRKPAGDT